MDMLHVRGDPFKIFGASQLVMAMQGPMPMLADGRIEPWRYLGYR